MKKIDCELTDFEYVLMIDMLSHCNYDNDEAEAYLSLMSKLKVKFKRNRNEKRI